MQLSQTAAESVNRYNSVSKLHILLTSSPTPRSREILTHVQETYSRMVTIYSNKSWK